MIAQYFHYEIIEIHPLEKLEEFKEHRRLQVFFHKGCRCVECGVEGEVLALGEDRKKNKHWDVYTKDLYPMTVDHIIPKFFGGSNSIENLQPMCCQCNWKKGDGVHDSKKYYSRPKYPITTEERKQKNFSNKHNVEKVVTPIIGETVFKKSKKRTSKIVFLGEIEDIVINPHTGRESVKIVGHPGSYYHTSILFRNAI